MLMFKKIHNEMAKTYMNKLIRKGIINKLRILCLEFIIINKNVAKSKKAKATYNNINYLCCK